MKMKTTTIIHAAMLLLGATASATPILLSGPAVGSTGNTYEIWGYESGDDKNWSVADTFATGLGGYLATLTSAVENDFVYGLLDPQLHNAAWIGGFQIPGSQEPDFGWTWGNGEGLIPAGANGVVGYSNWLPGEPNNTAVGGGAPEPGMTIGHFNQNGWNDEGALSNLGGFVVEYESVSNVPDSGSSALLLFLGIGGLVAKKRFLAKR